MFGVDKKSRLSGAEWAIAVCILLAAYKMRSLGGFVRYPSSGDELAVSMNTLRLKSLFMDGNFRSFGERFFDFYTRPSIYVINLFGLLLGGKAGVYRLYTFFGLSSIIVLAALSRKLFEDNYAALGTMFLGAFSTLHVNYSMKLLSNIVCFTFISASLYFFFKSLYENNVIRDKILAGLFIGIAFTCHNSAGPFPFMYIAAEAYIFITEQKKNIKPFLTLLLCMAIPIIFWEGICLAIIHSGEVTFTSFRHYIKKLMFHENLGFTTPFSRFYFIGIILRLESAVFPILVVTGTLGLASKCFKISKKQKVMFLMLFVLCLFYAFVKVISGMPRLIFPIYVFLLPLGGNGVSLLYRKLLLKGSKLGYILVCACFIVLVHNSLVASDVVAAHQRVPEKMFEFLKERQTVKVIVPRGSMIAAPYMDLSREAERVENIHDKTGYNIKLYFAETPDEMFSLARKNDIKYILVSYLSYDFRLGWPRHFMYSLHADGLGRPEYLLGPEERFPISIIEEEPFRYLEYAGVYGRREEPLSPESLIYHSMIYDISPLVAQ